MKTQIFVYLLNEGTDVWRPVEATRIGSNVYILHGEDIYDPEDEEWEFLPGSHVLVEEKTLSSGKCLVAIKHL